MDNKEKKRKLKGKRPKPLERKTADYLVAKSEQNEKLRTKKISTDFFKLFNDKDQE
jgi:hypothetical protein